MIVTFYYSRAVDRPRHDIIQSDLHENSQELKWVFPPRG